MDYLQEARTLSRRMQRTEELAASDLPWRMQRTEELAASDLPWHIGVRPKGVEVEHYVPTLLDSAIFQCAGADFIA
ncbi:hypothetical protein B296_00031134 [Ensete ventricosum]|uniref:Uncharacterized protein n=1 Tax=Ensete ventricosum TaxID=4639 RepID=A0A426Y884_ENSVE|nr:hypothetical protein B296_00031134 [Ensete ventricosum]